MGTHTEGSLGTSLKINAEPAQQRRLRRRQQRRSRVLLALWDGALSGFLFAANPLFIFKNKDRGCCSWGCWVNRPQRPRKKTRLLQSLGACVCACISVPIFSNALIHTHACTYTHMHTHIPPTHTYTRAHTHTPWEAHIGTH